MCCCCVVVVVVVVNETRDSIQYLNESFVGEKLNNNCRRFLRGKVTFRFRFSFIVVVDGVKTPDCLQN
jgi:hypothetical protein